MSKDIYTIILRKFNELNVPWKIKMSPDAFIGLRRSISTHQVIEYDGYDNIKFYGIPIIIDKDLGEDMLGDIQFLDKRNKITERIFLRDDNNSKKRR